MANEKRPRGRPRASDGPAIKREALLDAATRAFAYHGFDATSVRKLTREVGVSHTLVNHYFSSKRELWKACIDRSFGTMNREIGSILTAAPGNTQPEDAFRRMIVRYVKLSERFPNNTLLLLHESWKGGERFDYIIRHYFVDFMQLARSYYRANVDAGLMRAIPWQSVFTMVFVGGPGLFSMQHLVDVLAEEGGDEIDGDRHAEAVADLIMRGLVVR